jgi:hypothetical protein
MEYREPWYGSSDPSLVAESMRKISPGHVLCGIPLRALARRRDTDDVLFELQDGSGRLAKVRLSWRRASDPTWPATTTFLGPAA